MDWRFAGRRLPAPFLHLGKQVEKLERACYDIHISRANSILTSGFPGSSPEGWRRRPLPLFMESLAILGETIQLSLRRTG
jgi:hypothetical protein